MSENLKRDLDEFWRRHLREEAAPVQDSGFARPPANDSPNEILKKGLKDYNDLWRQFYRKGEEEPVPAPGLIPPPVTGYARYFSPPTHLSFPMIPAYSPMMLGMNYENYSHLMEKISNLEKQVVVAQNLKTEMESMRTEIGALKTDKEHQYEEIQNLKKSIVALCKATRKNEMSLEFQSVGNQKSSEELDPALEDSGPSTSTESGTMSKGRCYDSEGRYVGPFFAKYAFPK